MGNIAKPTIILALIVFFATFALSHINKITYPDIIKQEKQKQENALAVALPGYRILSEKKSCIDGSDFIYWTGEKIQEGRVLKGYAFIAEKNGYSGPVRTIVGVDEKRIILGISIVQQSETPGLGARCTEIASKETFIQHFFGRSAAHEEKPSPWFQDQFKGLDTGVKILVMKKGDWKPEMRRELLEKNGISAITGATITTRTVRDSIEKGIINLKKALGPEKR